MRRRFTLLNLCKSVRPGSALRAAENHLCEVPNTQLVIVLLLSSRKSLDLLRLWHTHSVPYLVQTYEAFQVLVSEKVS